MRPEKPTDPSRLSVLRKGVGWVHPKRKGWQFSVDIEADVVGNLPLTDGPVQDTASAAGPLGKDVDKRAETIIRRGYRCGRKQPSRRYEGCE